MGVLSTRQVQCSLSGLSYQYRIALALQTILKAPRHCALIFYDQDPLSNHVLDSALHPATQLRQNLCVKTRSLSLDELVCDQAAVLITQLKPVPIFLPPTHPLRRVCGPEAP
jgi:hypothetical protein